tara:strand:+ start:377 stop:565 length:189 start_codon:yes stop_codon:yes gene_type:complete
LKIIIPLLIIIFFLIKYLTKPGSVNNALKDEMASCVNCGTFIPESLAIKKDENIFCSQNCIT